MGRKRSFDTDHAIEQAMLLFWERGYEATSLSDLGAAMGLNPPSIYAAFGNKQGLFERCAHRYAETIAAYGARALEAEPTVATALTRYLYEAIDAFTAEGRPRGCLLVSAATNCGTDSVGAQTLLANYRAGSEAAIADRIRRGIAEGDLSADVESVALAKFIAVQIQGLAAQARDGATAPQLRQVAKLALGSLDPGRQ